MQRTARLLDKLGVPHGFSDAAEGDGRRASPPKTIVLARQVHGARAIWGGTLGGAQPEEADAVLCRTGGGAGVLTADCVPVLLFDPIAGFAAAVHAGWRGTLANTVESAVRSLTAAGAEAGRLVAAIGPCIRVCCYQVNDELIQEFGQVFGSRVSRPGRLLDLAFANRQRLTGCGISDDKIEDLGECTHCAIAAGKPRYFSHRRDATQARQLSWIRVATG
jgi:YfiH family protein